MLASMQPIVQSAKCKARLLRCNVLMKATRTSGKAALGEHQRWLGDGIRDRESKVPQVWVRTAATKLGTGIPTICASVLGLWRSEGSRNIPFCHDLVDNGTRNPPDLRA